MSWQPELDELRRREAMAREGGGADKTARQHTAGRLTVRERIDKLVDDGSFHEIGAIAGAAQYDEDGELVRLTPSNNVMGRARIDGRRIVVSGDDFTVRGGSADATIPEKNILAERMAAELRLPIIRIIEGSGGGGSVKTIETTGRANLPGGRTPSAISYKLLTDALGTVPVVALGLGSVAGLGAARLAASHFSVMTKKTSAMFVAGPPVVNRLGGPEVTKEELGGWKIQCKAGAVDHAVDTEEEAFEAAKRYLSYLPNSVHSVAERTACDDPADRADERLLSVIPRDRRKVYRMRPVVETIFDMGSFFEFGAMFGRSIITGFARLGGLPVAVMAADPFHYGGSWTANACAKITRFVDTAETFHMPIIHLNDCPGFFVGVEAERTATIRAGVRAMAAINQSTVPWCTVIMRNNFGVAGAAHVPSGRLAIRYAWPSAWWGSLPLEGGIEAAYRAEIGAAEDKQAKLEEIEARLGKLRSPYRTAEAFWVEEIIDPRETRRLLCDFAELAEPVRVAGPRSFAMRP